MLSSINETGKGTPITPVEATATSDGEIEKASAASLAMRFAASIPACPVHALALPELAIMARNFPPAIFSRLTCTLAAHTLLVVNIAAAQHSFSE